MNHAEKDFYYKFAKQGEIRILPKEVAYLVHQAAHDLGIDGSGWLLQCYAASVKRGLYALSSTEADEWPDMGMEEAFAIMQHAGVMEVSGDICQYLSNLALLYRRRSKYLRILQTQPFPEGENIAPRSLLEYGRCHDEVLFPWMSWRKLIFDLDNRSAQETGYLFEPIFTSCLGGCSLSPQTSVVFRLDSEGRQTQQGRQVDCYVEDRATVYELKMRVTEAASGQGRFKEEMSFPLEAAAAGLKPVLVVLDGTPSVLLQKLCSQYENAGGEYAVGESAWKLLKQDAGKSMGIFMSKYIEPPLTAARDSMVKTPCDLSLKMRNGHMLIEAGSGQSYVIERHGMGC